MLNEAVHNLRAVRSPDFWAEELACQVRGEGGYQFDANRQQYLASLVNGIDIRFLPDFSHNRVQLNLSYAATASANRRNVSKFLEGRMPECLKLLETAGFDISKGSGEMWAASFSIEASISVREIQEHFSRIVGPLKQAIERISVQ